MASLRCIIKKYQHQGKLTKEEADGLLKKLDNHDKILIEDFIKKNKDIKIIQPINYQYVLRDTFPNFTNSCNGCDIYMRILKGETVVNDMCTFCSRNPNKITCNSVTTINGNR